MSEGGTVDPDIEQLVRSAPTLRDLVLNTVTLTTRFIDYERYRREIDPGLALSGLNAAQRFDRLVNAAGGFSTDPELAGCGNCFFFSILGHAHDLFVALPGLTDTELAREASEVVQAIQGLPEEYLPAQDPDAEHDADADAATENGTVRLHDYFAAALIAVQGWFIGAYAPPSDVPLSETHRSEADKKRFAEFEKQQDPGWEPNPGGSCNFVMAE